MFKIDNIDISTLGVIADVEDFKQKAQMRYEEIIVEGRDGSRFNELGRSNVSKSFKLTVLDPTYMDDVFSLFDGKRTIEFDDKITYIYFYDALETTNMNSIREITVSYIRSPFWYKKEEAYLLVNSIVVNEGNVTSKPILKLVGTGNVSITINDISFKYSFGDDKEVLIDCEELTETLNGISKSKKITIGFEYPTLKPGTNKISKDGNVEIYIKRKDLWL